MNQVIHYKYLVVNEDRSSRNYGFVSIHLGCNHAFSRWASASELYPITTKNPKKVTCKNCLRSKKIRGA